VPVSQVIIQAGGRGTRLETLTRNRPKCLVPVDGRPLLYHTFAAFPGASFTVIADYRGDVVRRYLDAFPPGVEVRIVEADGDGTCGGIAKAAAGLDQDKPAALVWSDLVFDFPPGLIMISPVMIALTDAFPCRWRGMPIRRHRPKTLAEALQAIPAEQVVPALREVNTRQDGVLGLFGFDDPRLLSCVPRSGDFMEWMQESGLWWEPVWINTVREYGTAQALRDHWDAAPASRWFNSVEIGPNFVVKKARTPEFQHLINDEASWYVEVGARRGFRNVPHFDLEVPDAITMERLDGRHPFEIQPSADKLHAIMDTLSGLHALAAAPTNRLAVREMYADKPRARLAHIAKLAPDYAVRDTIRINGRACRNPLGHPHMFTGLLAKLTPDSFAFIHGDPTFSNMLIDDAGKVWLIDPRGRFGSVQFYGDPAYDWAKLWYSVVGGYDQFNRKRFVLTLDGPTVEIEIAPSGWEHLAPAMAERLGPDMMRRVRVLHGLIWLSLSGYVTEDYDAMLGAWFKGMLELETALA